MDKERDQLKKELNQTLKKIAASDMSEIELQGDAIREVFFTMMAQNFTPQEIEEVFKDVHISDKKMAMIEENDQVLTR